MTDAVLDPVAPPAIGNAPRQSMGGLRLADTGDIVLLALDGHERGLADGRRFDRMAAMAEQGIATRRGVMASHLEPFYRAQYPNLVLPVTEAASSETLLLPLYVGMTEAEQDAVIGSLLAGLDGGR